MDAKQKMLDRIEDWRNDAVELYRFGLKHGEDGTMYLAEIEAYRVASEAIQADEWSGLGELTALVWEKCLDSDSVWMVNYAGALRQVERFAIGMVGGL